MHTTTDRGTGADTEAAVFARARDWLYGQGEPAWIAEAFGHWVIAEITPHEVPATWSALMARWHHEPAARAYRARHGARVCGSPPWAPGDPLPSPPTSPCAGTPAGPTARVPGRS